MVMSLLSNPKGAVGTVVVAADGTGDTTDIQTGIDLLPATGGCVYIKEGNYNLTDEITINVDNTALVGCGRSSHVIQTTANIIINATGRDYIHIEKLFLDGDGNTSNVGVRFSITTGSRVINCWIEDCGQQGIHNVTSVNNCLFKGNVITGTTNEGILVQGSTGTIISNNFIHDCDWGVVLDVGNNTGNLINDNYVVGNAESGIALHESDGNIVDGNVCDTNGDDGIFLFGSRENIISNNSCTDNSTSVANSFDGIRLVTGDTHECVRNVICDNKCSNYVDNDQRYGIRENDANQDYNTIVGNVCYNNTTADISVQGVNTVYEHNIPPKIRYWSCAGEAFKCTDDEDEWDADDGILEARGDLQRTTAPVYLPNGAIVTGVIVYGNISDEDWLLQRITLAAPAYVTMATAALNTEDTSITSATIDNSLYGYYFYTDALDTGDQIYGARITYTL